MPTTKRMRRHARGPRGVDEWSTKWQVLMLGHVILEHGPDFETGQEARSSWREHREELMGAKSPGQRPAAYYRYDLRIDWPSSKRWYDELNLLMDRGLIDEKEAALIDAGGARGSNLSAAVGSVGGQSFDSFEGIRQQQLGPFILNELAHEFGAAARWQGWRNRPELAKQYEARAETIRKFLEEAPRG